MTEQPMPRFILCGWDDPHTGRLGWKIMRASDQHVAAYTEPWGETVPRSFETSTAAQAFIDRYVEPGIMPDPDVGGQPVEWLPPSSRINSAIPVMDAPYIDVHA